MRFRPTDPGLGRRGFLSRAQKEAGHPWHPITERGIRVVEGETHTAVAVCLSPTYKDCGIGLVDNSVFVVDKDSKNGSDSRHSHVFRGSALSLHHPVLQKIMQK